MFNRYLSLFLLLVGLSFVLATRPATAAAPNGEVGRYEGPAGVLVLTTLTENCEAGMKAFFGAHVANGPFTGCYLVLGDRVLVEFDDGSVGFMPLGVFKLRAA